MGLTRERMLELSAARDKRYNGKFITGVLSTGIFCLPSCSARSPKPENVRFFFSPEAAVKAGLRACRRCRPDLFYQQRDPDLEQIESAVAAVRGQADAARDVDALARLAGFGRSKLTRLMQRHYHASPAAFLQAARIARSVELLAETRRKVLDIAMESGFESESTFHDNFLRANGMSPGAYRRMLASRDFTMQLPEDFNLQATFHYLGRDPESATEGTDLAGRRAWRVLRSGRRPLTLELSFSTRGLRCEVRSPGAIARSTMVSVHQSLRRWLGLGTTPRRFELRAKRDPFLRGLVKRRSGLRIVQTPTIFEGFVWAVVGQQINLPFAYRLRRQLLELCGRRTGAGLFAHPTPSEVATLDYEDLTRRQFSRRKAEYLIDASRRFAENDIEKLRELAVPRASEALLAVRGVGEWTAQYVLMRSCSFADCAPIGDAGLVKALARVYDLESRPGPDQTRELMAPLAPHRSLATAHLWMSLAD